MSGSRVQRVGRSSRSRHHCVLPDGRTLEYWEGGNPDGRGVVFHPGSPCGRMFGQLGHDAGGAGPECGSSPSTGPDTSGFRPRSSGAPSLLAAGHDTAALTRYLGLDDYAVLGVSGGGLPSRGSRRRSPTRTAVRAVRHRRRSGAVGRDVVRPVWQRRATEFACLALPRAGDVAGARAGAGPAGRRRERGPSGELDDEGRVDALPRSHAGPAERERPAPAGLCGPPTSLSVASAVGRLRLRHPAAGRGSWDLDPGDVLARTCLWYGADDDVCPPAHGQWYADHIEDSEMTIFTRGGTPPGLRDPLGRGQTLHWQRPGS